MTADGCRIQKRDAMTCLVIALVVALVYSQTLDFAFINYDDNHYVTENPHVRSGLTSDGIRWAFTESYAANWHPLTWISHMIDVSIWGMNSGAHHATNVVLHAIAAVFLFLTIRLASDRPMLSAVAALVWALHPLRVESVAWVAERKDVLSGAFCFATTTAYVLYATGRRRAVWYALTCFMFTCGLLSKPTLVTLPFALLLLDCWPLRRRSSEVGTTRATVRQLVVEKLPLIALGAAVAVATWHVQSQGKSVTQGLVHLPSRIANAVVSIASYLRCMFAPYDLAVHYPHPYMPGGNSIPTWQIAASLVLLIGITALVVWHIKCLPYLAVGWFWFLGTLVPMSGLIQVGIQARADRYTYIPSVGITLGVVWLVHDALQRVAIRQAIGLACLAAAAWLTVRQTAHWRNSLTLMSHSARVAPNSLVALLNLGAAYDTAGDLANAERAYRRTLATFPEDGVTLSNLSSLLIRTGRLDEAQPILEYGIRLHPTFPGIQLSMAEWLTRRGDMIAAQTHFERAIALDPTSSSGHHLFALALAEDGRLSEAVVQWEIALRIDSANADALDGLARVKLIQGDELEAQALLRRAIDIKPSLHGAMYVLAWSQATSADPRSRSPEQSLYWAGRALSLSPGEPMYLDAQAAALARNGRFADAASVADRAVVILSQNRRPEVESVRRRADLYRAGRTYVQVSPAGRQ